MKTFNKTIVGIFFAIVMMMLAGCPGTMGGDILVNKTKVVFIEPDASMVTNCDITAPPAKEEYLASDNQNREALLSTWGRSQTSNLGTCNKKWDNLRKWVSDQKAIYLKPSEK